MTPLRRIAASLIMVTIATTTAACSSDTTSPSAPTASGIPTITRWLNQTCSPEGAKAKTRSGADIICEQVGSDPAPEWHAIDPSPSTPTASGTPILSRWMNQTCSPEGATAKTTAGSNLICKKVGKEAVPEWHAAD